MKKIKLIKIILSVYLLAGFMSCECSAVSSDQNKTEKNNNSEVNNISLSVCENSDTLNIFLKITNMLPIGWGTNYKCEILYDHKTYESILDTVFVMSASVGSEDLFKNVNIHLLKKDIVYYADFVKSERITDKSYIPVGTTGFKDKNGNIWDMISIKEVKK